MFSRLLESHTKPDTLVYLKIYDIPLDKNNIFLEEIIICSRISRNEIYIAVTFLDTSSFGGLIKFVFSVSLAIILQFGKLQVAFPEGFLEQYVDL